MCFFVIDSSPIVSASASGVAGWVFLVASFSFAAAIVTPRSIVQDKYDKYKEVAIGFIG